MLVSPEDDYRDVLRRELDSRLKHNPRYSLRAFARDIELSPSRLSEVLNRKQGLSKQVAVRISKHLDLGVQDRRVFADLVEKEHARSRLKKNLASVRLEKQKLEQKFVLLKDDTFRVLADWEHFAILQMIPTEGFQSDPMWIAKRLGIPAERCKEALARLQRTGMMEDQGGEFIAKKPYTRSEDGIPSEAIQQYHRQMLEKADQALSEQTVDERDFSAIVFPMSKSKIPRVKTLIKEFRRKLAEEMNRTGEWDEVYSLTTQFFRMTEESRENGEH